LHCIICFIILFVRPEKSTTTKVVFFPKKNCLPSFVLFAKMSVQLRKYAALFLLALFVFPFVEKGIHDVTHSKDVHCSAKNSKHFHTSEHHCSICDFTLSFSTAPDYFQKAPVNIHYESLVCCSYTDNFTVAPAFLFSLRGPPSA
jgi:hypothetical protein